MFWDATLTPRRAATAVTTVIGGNCGLTLAPVAPHDRDYLTRLLARVEAIPVEALVAGLEYRWSTYPEFLDVLEASALGPNIGFMVGHSAVRRAVMGPAASERAATPDELAAMCELLSEAIGAGGMGFSTANVETQVDGDGRPTPPNFATSEEFVALAAVCGRHPGTSIEFIPGSFLKGFSDEDIELMADMSAAANRHLNWNTPLINKAAPSCSRRQLWATDVARYAGGGWIVPLYMAQNGPTQQDFLRGYVYRALPDWGWLFELGVAERIQALADPAARERLRAALDGVCPPGWPSPSARRGARTTSTRSRGRTCSTWRAGGYRRSPPSAASATSTPCSTSPWPPGWRSASCATRPARVTKWTKAARLEVLKDPRVVLGASDAGAHVDMMVGADFPTRCLGELVRDRGVFSLEEMVHQFTDVPAQLYGLRDRGRLTPGSFADIVILDPDVVGAGPLRTVPDLPGPGRPGLLTEPARGPPRRSWPARSSSPRAR